MIAHEVNFDGIVGPTHNYAGLSYGNVASMSNKSSVSSPRQAALEGLAKMKFMAGLGLKQAVLPPHERPHVPTLKRLGYSGSDAAILAAAAKADPVLLAACSSASAMWAANAATVSPSSDTADARLHFTPANLVGNLHRSIETATTVRLLRAIFADESHFVHHSPLPATPYLGDEGAANHTRLCGDYGERGVEIFTFGRSAANASSTSHRFPARQTREASEAVARLHQLSDDRTVFVQQSAAAIDAGAFHNDVVAVGNRELLLYHENAWENVPATLEAIRRALPSLRAVGITNDEVPLDQAVASYLFNGQLVTPFGPKPTLVVPEECRTNDRVRSALDRMVDRGDVAAVHFVDLRQSMRNGGGPACLRLRVVLNDEELSAINSGVLYADALHGQLHDWIVKHYRDRLEPADLADPQLLDESRRALDELTALLGLRSIYDFQR